MDGLIPPDESALPPAAAQLREAAVLVPVYRDDAGQLRLVLLVRSNFGVHGGQLAFPGGKQDPTDSSLLDTALREAEEEVYLPRTAVQVLAELPYVSTPTGYRVTPYLGRITRPAVWRWLEREVLEVLEVPLSELLDPARHATEHWQLPEWPRPAPVSFIRIGEHKLWGLSYRIVRQLLPRLTAGEWAL
ncbi:CoA pyrophosphatase [Hymenobacter sp. 15J16-1T3B]|uniref:NUDIX hydrolase n=1 Tax=Hymenobacter sp. 15J16-1T3B TaxID=2886941 RepID=UPI001D113F7D|nr:CoA pyrophosphatase [Hymenobacter sp. 15J16-1T3B]MCC3157250.1 CoA pyrophosphatase [Hymenobacter sp. 15J16-1T3B]